MGIDLPLAFNNGEIVSLKNIPVFSIEEFREIVIKDVKDNARIVALFGKPVSDKVIRLFAVLAHDKEGKLFILSADASGKYSSLTPECPQAHLFEREIAEQWGIIPEGHPWLKPVRLHDKMPEFFNMGGKEIHEVAVGPVHAGIIEPGHFRFLCHGEDVFHLEISLGYQHRGIEKKLLNGPDKKTLRYMETLAGDTTAGHSVAYCQLLESLARSNVTVRGHALRAIALELERLANHTGDLGAMANDVAYLPTASYCGRLRGDFLNMTALICGNRFGRGMVVPGGAEFDIDDTIISRLTKEMNSVFRDLTGAVELLWDTPSVVDRFEGTGSVEPGLCRELGMVGVAARACGFEQDIRFDFPTGINRFTHIPVSTYTTGDVFARAYVRWLEIKRSVEFIRDQIKSLPDGAAKIKVGQLNADSLAVSLVEGWRGEICHIAMTDESGRFSHYKVIDPSFHNWMGLSMALRNEQISDFPLCNKSFNLSYCGYDL
jgi:Ni,Fe-hydrogenase III large subunit